MGRSSGQQSALGYFGAAELSVVLRLRAEKCEAFIRKLQRERRKLGNGNWLEVRDPQPNSPAYLFRADADQVQKIAKSYQ